MSSPPVRFGYRNRRGGRNCPLLRRSYSLVQLYCCVHWLFCNQSNTSCRAPKCSIQRSVPGEAYYAYLCNPQCGPDACHGRIAPWRFRERHRSLEANASAPRGITLACAAQPRTNPRRMSVPGGAGKRSAVSHARTTRSGGMCGPACIGDAGGASFPYHDRIAVVFALRPLWRSSLGLPGGPICGRLCDHRQPHPARRSCVSPTG
jgi:hypothetical protein